LIEVLIFIIISIAIVWISLASLRRPGSHGFYRFFAWEVILGLFVLNLRGWFTNPFSWYQILSWMLLVVCLIPLISGVILLRTIGKPTDELEATTHLVTKGIYGFIRHPLYASLLYLTWGIFFKSPSLMDSCLAVVSTAFIVATAHSDEAECLVKFGQEYRNYIKRTKMFVPFIY
jgi:protein-S-isoprenylcysteine O-methyltransferase Ste14